MTTRVRAILFATVALALISTVALVLLTRQDSGGLTDATGLLRSDGNFTTPPESAETFAAVATVLLDVGRRCSETKPEVICGRYLSGAALAQAFAVPATTCSLPVISRARRDLLAYVEALKDETATPDLPQLPLC